VRIVRSFNDPRIRCCTHEKNQGLVASLNDGFARATGQYLTWTSDDNWYEPCAFEHMAGYLNGHADIAFVYAGYRFVDAEGRAVRGGRTRDPAFLDEDNCVGGCFLYRRTVYEELGAFDQDFFLVEDYEYWLRVRAHFGMKRLDDILYCARLHERSLTATHTPREVQTQVEKARNKYIRQWKRLFFEGRDAFTAATSPARARS